MGLMAILHRFLGAFALKQPLMQKMGYAPIQLFCCDTLDTLSGNYKTHQHY